MTKRIEVFIEGFTPEEILDLPDEDLEALVLTDMPLVLRVGSAEILGQFRLQADYLVVELAHIDGGGEGVLPTLWVLAERYAKKRGLLGVEWVVHATNCAAPNPMLRQVLERRGFVVTNVPGVGEAYHYLHLVNPEKLRAIFKELTDEARRLDEEAKARGVVATPSDDPYTQILVEKLRKQGLRFE